MENLILKCFVNDSNFIKIMLKSGFANWHIWRENWDKAYIPVFGMIYET